MSGKEQEQYLLERFLECRPDLPPMREWRQPSPDPPDFEGGTNFSVSLEMTRLSHEADMRDRDIIDDFHADLDRAMRQHGLTGYLHISYEATDAICKGKARERTIRALLPLLRESLAGPEPVRLYPFHLHSAGIRDIDSIACHPFEHPIFSNGRSAVGDCGARILERIRRKEANLARYASAYAERWLLLVTRLGLSEPRLDDAPAKPLHDSPFDRVYLFDIQDKVVRELTGKDAMGHLTSSCS